MNRERIDRKVDEIDSIIRSELWFDFQISGYRGDSVVVMGGLDFTYGHNLEIEFMESAFVNSALEWGTDTSKGCVLRITPLEMLTPEQCSRYFINGGTLVFSFLSESFDGWKWYDFVANDIEYRYTGSWESWQWYTKGTPPLP